MQSLLEIANRCKASAGIRFNEHRSNYDSIEEYLGWSNRDEDPEDIDEEERALIKKVIELLNRVTKEETDG